MSQNCKSCGKPITVMIQKNTGYCCGLCQDTKEEDE